MGLTGGELLDRATVKLAVPTEDPSRRAPVGPRPRTWSKKLVGHRLGRSALQAGAGTEAAFQRQPPTGRPVRRWPPIAARDASRAARGWWCGSTPPRRRDDVAGLPGGRPPPAELLSGLGARPRNAVARALAAKKATVFSFGTCLPPDQPGPRANGRVELTGDGCVGAIERDWPAAEHLAKFFFPMFMTAAGTVAAGPRVLVMGVGRRRTAVHRHGAPGSARVVKAYERCAAAAKEEAESLGATFPRHRRLGRGHRRLRPAKLTPPRSFDRQARAALARGGRPPFRRRPSPYGPAVCLGARPPCSSRRRIGRGHGRGPPSSFDHRRRTRAGNCEPQRLAGRDRGGTQRPSTWVGMAKPSLGHADPRPAFPSTARNVGQRGWGLMGP